MLLYFCCSTVCIYSTFNTILQRSPKNVPVRVSIEALYRVEWFCISMNDDPHDAQFFFFFWGGGGEMCVIVVTITTTTTNLNKSCLLPLGIIRDVEDFVEFL